ncbi:MAG: type VI secretion system contractile sheath large subunit [Polyangiaceae bacterium]
MASGAGISFGVRGRLGNQQAPKREAEDPFRLLLVADFSGRAFRSQNPELSRPRRADVDQLEQLFAPFAAEIEVSTPDGRTARLRPRSLEDLHPDVLFANLSCFEEGRTLLAALSERVASPETLERARRYLGQAQSVAGNAATADSNDSSTLDRLLGRAPSTPAPAGEARPSPLSALLEQAVAPHKAETPGGERDRLRAELERRLEAGLRGILQSPALRALEASWRGADRVIRALDTDEALEISAIRRVCGRGRGHVRPGRRFWSKRGCTSC